MVTDIEQESLLAASKAIFDAVVDSLAPKMKEMEDGIKLLVNNVLRKELDKVLKSMQANVRDAIKMERSKGVRKSIVYGPTGRPEEIIETPLE